MSFSRSNVTCVPTVNWIEKACQLPSKLKSIFCDERSVILTCYHKGAAHHRLTAKPAIGNAQPWARLPRSGRGWGDKSFTVVKRQLWWCLGTAESPKYLPETSCLPAQPSPAEKGWNHFVWWTKQTPTETQCFLYKYKICPPTSSTNVILSRYQYTPNRKHTIFPSSSFHELIEVHALTHAVTQPCLTLCDPLDGNPSGSSVQGIFQVRILEWEGPFPPLGDLPDPGIEHVTPALQVVSLPLSQQGNPGNAWSKIIHSCSTDRVFGLSLDGNNA